MKGNNKKNENKTGEHKEQSIISHLNMAGSAQL
jgi:hypothetical protein